jgi:hypothetical protein
MAAVVAKSLINPWLRKLVSLEDPEIFRFIPQVV